MEELEYLELQLLELKVVCMELYCQYLTLETLKCTKVKSLYAVCIGVIMGLGKIEAEREL